MGVKGLRHDVMGGRIIVPWDTLERGCDVGVFHLEKTRYGSVWVVVSTCTPIHPLTPIFLAQPNKTQTLSNVL